MNQTTKIVRPIRYQALGAGIISFLVVFLAVRFIIIGAALADSPMEFYSNSAYQKEILLKNFPVYQQSYANSCGPTTIRMAYSYLVEPISEQELAQKLGFSLGKSGMLPAQFYETLNSALGDHGFQIEHQVNIPNTVFLERTYVQLQQGFPVPIYFSTINAWNKPNYDTHYSLIIGITPAKKEVTIANAYGFVENMPISELLGAVKYDNYLNAPLYFRAGLFASVINKNNFFRIKK